MTEEDPELAENVLEKYFSQDKPFNDVALVVENKEIWIPRATLASYSPVFERMFFGEFKEKSQNRIPLPEKIFEDILCLATKLIPCPILADITWINIKTLLELSDEYQIEDLKYRARKFLLAEINTLKWLDEKVFKILSLTSLYKFNDLTKRCIPFACGFEVSEIDKHFDEMSPVTVAILYEKKLKTIVISASRSCHQISCSICKRLVFEPRLLSPASTYCTCESILAEKIRQIE